MLFVVLKAYGNLEALLLAIYNSVSKSLQTFYSRDGNIISPLNNWLRPEYVSEKSFFDVFSHTQSMRISA